MSFDGAKKKFSENVQLASTPVGANPKMYQEWNLNSGLVSLTEAIFEQFAQVQIRLGAIEQLLRSQR